MGAARSFSTVCTAAMLMCRGEALRLHLAGAGLHDSKDAVFLATSPGAAVSEPLLPVPLSRPWRDRISVGELTGRDGGLWDEIPWSRWSTVPFLSKRRALSSMEGKARVASSAWHALAKTLQEVCDGASFVECRLEDDYRGALPNVRTFGGAVLAAAGTELVVLEAEVEEAIALAVALDLPLVIDDEMFWESCAEGGAAQLKDGKLCITTESDPATLRATQGAGGARTAGGDLEGVSAAWEIRSAEAWGELTTDEKRAVCIVSGVVPPRRARGEEALDALLLPLLDEDVRRDLDIAEALRRGDMAVAQRLSNDRSERGIVKLELQRAVLEEDYERAAELKALLEVLNAAKADPTQEDGSYDRYLDADDWYLRNLEK